MLTLHAGKTAPSYRKVLAQVYEPQTPAQKLQGLGEAARKVHVWLAGHNEAFLKEAVIIGHPHTYSPEEIAADLGMELQTVQGSVIALARNGLIERLTADGRIAA